MTTEIFDVVWCSSCGLEDNAIVIYEDFGPLCEDNFWGQYRVEIACANCSAEDTILGTHDGVETEINYGSAGVLLPPDSNKAKELQEEVAILVDIFKARALYSDIDPAVINPIVTKLCLRESDLLSAIIRVSLKTIQPDPEIPFEIPCLVFTTYECARVKRFLQYIRDEQEYRSFDFDCQPAATVEYRRGTIEDAETNEMLFPVIQVLRDSGLCSFEPKFWLNHKGPDGHLSFGMEINFSYAEGLMHVINFMDQHGLSVTMHMGQQEKNKLRYNGIGANKGIAFDSSSYADRWFFYDDYE